MILIKILAVDAQAMVGMYHHVLLHSLCIFIWYCETPGKRQKIYWKILEIY